MQDVEHERKFLVADEELVASLEDGTSLAQGYLPAEDGLSVRVRIIPAQDVFTLTVKGPRVGTSRVEIEHFIPSDIAVVLLQACGKRIIEKTRFPLVGPDGKIWTIDVFQQLNQGLVLAEVELESPDDEVQIPEWCGVEVTDDERYYNERLTTDPYTKWSSGSDDRS